MLARTAVVLFVSAKVRRFLCAAAWQAASVRSPVYLRFSFSGQTKQLEEGERKDIEKQTRVKSPPAGLRTRPYIYLYIIHRDHSAREQRMSWKIEFLKSCGRPIRLLYMRIRVLGEQRRGRFKK